MFRKAAKGSFGSFSAREALFAAFFAGGFLMATWITRTPAIREGLGLSIAEMGLVFLGLSLGSIPSLIFAPVLIHRAGARVMTLLGEALMLFGVFLAALPLALPCRFREASLRRLVSDSWASGPCFSTSR